MRSAFATVLEPLARQRGVLGCLVAGEEDGILVDAFVRDAVDGAALAALAAALHRRARLASGAAGLGGVSFVRLDADGGHLCVLGHNELVLAVFAQSGANVGVIRSTMLRSLEALA
ncbi:MAG TPA: roadblock/LC7 domain-containing protein [Gemmatimonadaceae bacterium]|nr:roadblock/LC7 domain-containing protein [Gemmatimonadaceae bacterium]